MKRCADRFFPAGFSSRISATADAGLRAASSAHAGRVARSRITSVLMLILVGATSLVRATAVFVVGAGGTQAGCGSSHLGGRAAHHRDAGAGPRKGVGDAQVDAAAAASHKDMAARKIEVHAGFQCAAHSVHPAPPAANGQAAQADWPNCSARVCPWGSAEQVPRGAVSPVLGGLRPCKGLAIAGLWLWFAPCSPSQTRRPHLRGLVQHGLWRQADRRRRSGW